MNAYSAGSPPPLAAGKRTPFGRAVDFGALAVFVSLFALALADKYAQDFRVVWGRGAVAALALIDLAVTLRAEGRRAALRKGAFTVGGVAASVGLAALALALGGKPGLKAHDAWDEFFNYHAAELWAASLWLYAPWGLGVWARLTARKSVAAAEPGGPDLSRAIAGWLTAMTLWSFVTALTSGKPAKSFNYFAIEAGIYAPLFLFWLRHGRPGGWLARATARGGLALLALAMLAGAAVGWVFLLAGPDLQRQMVSFHYNYARLVDTVWTSARGFSPWRLEFPFGHHNRMAYCSMLALIILCFAALAGRRRGARIALAVAALLALTNMLMTLNRGVLVGLAPALALAAWARWRWRALWLLMLPPLLYMALPGPQRTRLRSIADPQTYTQRDSTVVYRFIHFRVACAMLAGNPVLGVGYGWKVVSDLYQNRYAEPMGLQPEDVSHAHNVWLQTGAESGLPGALLLLAFSVARWRALAGAWRRRGVLSPAQRGQIVFWAALEIAIQIYCLTNYPLRRSLGLITWEVWAVMTAEALALERLARGAAAPALEQTGSGRRPQTAAWGSPSSGGSASK